MTSGSGSKLGESTIRAPAATAAFIVHVWPNAWVSGSAASTASAALKANSRAVTCALETRFACVSSAPRGRPVVPDV